MNKREKEVAKAQLAAEQAVLKDLEKQYKSALNEINQKVKLFEYDIKMLDDALSMEGLDDSARAVLQSQKQSKVYQKQFQEALKGQVGGILDRLHGNNYSTIDEYLKQCYTDGFLGTMYDIAGQGIPMVMPIDQAAAVKAVMTDSKVSEGLYNALGVDVGDLKKAISSEITRGIASGLTYRDIARNISNRTMAPLNRAKTIARTEGHRIHQASTMDAQHRAKEKGADVVKQWDASLDGKTRPTHRRLDGQIREVDEPFEVDGKTAMAPGHFGKPGEDINCRCVSLTRARWALDEDELQTLRERAEYFGLDKTKDFADFKEKYLKAAAKPIANSINSSTIISGEYPEYSRIIRDVDAVEDAKKTNPNYSNHAYEYTHNCQRCVPAWELRQRGFDVIAQPCKPAGEHDALKTSPFNLWQFNPFDKDVSKRIQADRTGNGKDQIIEFLKASGNGARVEIVVAWDYNPAEGHAFAAKNVDGEILFIDPQNGKSGKYVEDYFNRVVQGETKWLRIDKLPLAERYRKEVIANPYERLD